MFDSNLVQNNFIYQTRGSIYSNKIRMFKPGRVYFKKKHFVFILASILDQKRHTKIKLRFLYKWWTCILQKI
jgi:hypothetical protein